MIGNQDSADCFNRALKFERIFQFLLPQGYLYRGGSKIWKDSIRNIVVIFQTNILRIVGIYVRHSANVYFFITLNLVTTSGWELSCRFNSVSYILGSGLSENSSRSWINAIFRLFPHSLGSQAVSISKRSLSGSLISNLE